VLSGRQWRAAVVGEWQHCLGGVVEVALVGWRWWAAAAGGREINVEAKTPGHHGKWWLDRKTGSDKCYCQQCMCCIVTPEAADSGKNMLSAKWIERDRETILVSLADKVWSLLSNPARVNGIKSKGMWAKHEGIVLLWRNNYTSYTMLDVPPIQDYNVVLPKGQFNKLHAHYNIHTYPDLGLGWAAVLCQVACSCGPCKDQLERPSV